MTIQKPIITELRYVNGQPDPTLRSDQIRINWAKNGEGINGASGDTTSDGVLNRSGVQIQENTLNSHVNTKSQQVAIEELVDTVNTLTGGAAADLGTRVSDVEADITTIELNSDLIMDKVGVAPDVAILPTGLFLSVDDLESDIGTRNVLDVANPLDINETVRQDLFFIKRRIGNDRGYDANGNPIIDANPKGMKFQIDDLYTRMATSNAEIGADDVVSSVKGRLTDLEDNDSIGSVLQIRTELGNTLDSDVSRPVYLRLDDAESTIVNNTNTLTAIDEIVNMPSTGLVDAVSQITTDLIGINSQIGTGVTNITEILDDVGTYDVGDLYASTIKGRLSSFNTDIDSIWGRIGSDDTAGGSLGYRVTSAENSLGDYVSPLNGTAWFAIQQNVGQLISVQSDLNSIVPSVGLDDITPGTLRYRMNNVESATNHTYANIKSLSANTAAVTNLDQLVLGFLGGIESSLGNYSLVGGVITAQTNSPVMQFIDVDWESYYAVGSDVAVTVTVKLTHVSDPDVSFARTKIFKSGMSNRISLRDIVEIKEGSTISVSVKANTSASFESEYINIAIK